MARVVVVGRFDGVHTGHQHLLREARRAGSTVVAYTFPPRGPSLLTLEAKVNLLRNHADQVEVVPWERVETLTPEAFVREELVGRLGATAVAVGPDHRFGKDRTGDVATLKHLGHLLGLAVHVVPPLCLDGGAVSSGRIRDLLGAGEVAGAARLLGRPPWISGQPIPGAHLAHQLGYPTVNLRLAPELVRPRLGVYAAWAHYSDGEGPALFYVGNRPTFPSLPPSAEVHLLTPPQGEVRGPVEVHLLSFIRPDERFPTPQALALQISNDIAWAQRIVGRSAGPKRLLPGKELRSSDPSP